MKIAVVSGSFPPDLCGIGDYTSKLCGEMRRHINSGEVHIITKAGPEREGTERHVMPCVKNWNLAGVCHTVRAIRRLQPDVVHIQYPPSAFRRSISTTLLPLFLRFLVRRARVFCTIHEFDNKTFAGKLRLLASMIPCHGLVVVDEGYKQSIARFCRFLSRRIAFIPIGSNIGNVGIAEEQRRALRRELGWAHDDVVIVHFGILREGKGIDQLIEAFRVAHKSCVNLRLLLAGAPGASWDDSSFRDMLREYQLIDSVHMTGRVSEERTSRYLSMADFAVFPFTDGVSTKRTGFMAAVEHGLPTVTTFPSSGMPELCDDVNVALVPPDNAEALAEAMIRVAGDEALRNRLAEGAALLRQTYSWDRIACAHLELYASALHATDPAPERFD